MVGFPEVPFPLQYFDLRDAELSDGGRVLVRVLGGAVLLVGTGLLLS